MDFVAFLLVPLPLVWWILYQVRGRMRNLPPGPLPFPIIGNIPQLSRNPHKSLAKLSKTYGPIMHVQLGSIETIVVSTPEMARQILQKHDDVCSGRVVPHAAEALNHHEFSVGYLPVGNKWRILRKICKEHMFTMPKLEATQGIRHEKLQQLREYLDRCSRGGSSAVDIGEAAFVTALNLISATLFSMELSDFDSTASIQRLKESILGVVLTSSTPNVADYFPIFKLFDPQGLRRKREFYSGKLMAIFDEIISKKLQSRDTPRREKDLLDALLDFNQENAEDLSYTDIKHLLMALMLAGTHTTSYSVQWAVSELLHNPEKLTKAKKELQTVIGENKAAEESDIPRLPYLNAVIRESLRCHPAGPFLVPHKAEADVEINGYTVPKGAQILVNEWAISRDPTTWPNPDSFEPERFLGSKIDYKGQDFEFIPFGSGRRICPGLPLAHLMVHVMVAAFIHNFDWKLEGGIKPQELNMTENFGFLFQKEVPLKAIPIKH